MTLGPLLAGLIASRWGIWGVYLTNGVLLVIAALAAAWLLRPQLKPQPA
jgi:hypothetical protein